MRTNSGKITSQTKPVGTEGQRRQQLHVQRQQVREEPVQRFHLIFHSFCKSV
jgi:hypothetical protein